MWGPWAAGRGGKQQTTEEQGRGGTLDIRQEAGRERLSHGRVTGGDVGEQEIHCSLYGMLHDPSGGHVHFSVKSTQHSYF